jgi:Ca-activated chloride channel family protein
MGRLAFGNPAMLYLLLLLVPLIGWYIYRHRTIFASVHFSGTSRFGEGYRNYKYYLRHLPFSLRIIILGLLILVLARPQSTNRWKNVSTEGIDIMLALDISGSMLSLDFKPDRIGAAKALATEFISGRPYDRMGLVVFSAESFTQCPLTSDHAALINLMHDVKSGMIDDGTAIGLGLANAVNRLKDSKSISKVIILLTDGVNNTGSIAPLTAAEIAKNFGIRVYTIGVGTQGTAPYPVQTQFGIQLQDMEVQIDEDILRKIAALTGGKYFRATDNEKLRSIYKEIDKLEKSKIETREYSKKQEEYGRFALAALLLFLLEAFLRMVVLKNIP